MFQGADLNTFWAEPSVVRTSSWRVFKPQIANLALTTRTRVRSASGMYVLMKALHALTSSSSFRVRSNGSFKQALEMTPLAFSKPAGLRTLATGLDVFPMMYTGFHFNSATRPMAWAAALGVVQEMNMSAPESFALSVASFCRSRRRQGVAPRSVQ